MNRAIMRVLAFLVETVRARVRFFTVLQLAIIAPSFWHDLHRALRAVHLIDSSGWNRESGKSGKAPRSSLPPFVLSLSRFQGSVRGWDNYHQTDPMLVRPGVQKCFVGGSSGGNGETPDPMMDSILLTSLP